MLPKSVDTRSNILEHYFMYIIVVIRATNGKEIRKKNEREKQMHIDLHGSDNAPRFMGTTENFYHIQLGLHKRVVINILFFSFKKKKESIYNNLRYDQFAKMPL